MAGSSPAMTVEGAVAAPELVPWRLDAFGLGAGWAGWRQNLVPAPSYRLILSASPPRSEIMTCGWGGDSAGWESFRPPWMRIP